MIRRFAVALVAIFMVMVSVASADPRQVVSTFGVAGSGDGELSAPTGGVAVRQSNGDVYVVDAGADRVQRFDAAGSYQAQFGANGGGDGLFRFAGNSGGVAVDQSDGSVYVADTGNNRVEKFSAAGGYVSQFGLPGSGDGEFASPIAVAVDPASHKVFVADRDNNRVQRFSAAGVYEAQLGTPGGGYGELSSPTGVAVDSTGAVYVLDAGNGRVQKFAANGDFQGVFSPGTLNLSPQALAIDPATDHVFVDQYAPDFSGTQIIELTANGNVVATHGTALPGVGGLDIRQSSGRIYASDAYGSRVLILDSQIVPDASVGDATAVTANGATLNGTIDAHGGMPVTYRFETSTDQATWTPTADAEPVTGSGATPVSTDITGLQPNTQYYVRLVANPALNASVTSGEQTFTTEAAAPTVATTSPKDLTAEMAILTGTIDAQGSPTTYYFEYGTTTSYGTSVPATQDADAGSANDPQAVTQKITGLTAGITYHYRIVAHNQAGTSIGADRTLTPEAAAGAFKLPDNRAYEQVSPVDKNDTDVQNYDSSTGDSDSQASPDGDRIAYKTVGTYPGSDGNTREGYALSARTGSAWSTTGLNPRRDPPALVATHDVFAFSEDLSRSVVGSTLALAPGAIAGMGNVYLRENATGALRLIVATADPSFPFDNRLIEGGSSDFSHIMFKVTDALAPGAVEGAGNTYLWSDGHLDYLGVCCLGNPSYRYMSNGSSPVAVDGSRAFLEVDDGPLLAVEPGHAAHAISLSQRTGEVGTVARVDFYANSRDGTSAIISTPQPLTDDTPVSPQRRDDLYRLEVGSGQLTNLTATIELAPGQEQELTDVPAVSADAKTVYFTLRTGVSTNPRQLFVSRNGIVQSIATLPDTNPWTPLTNSAAQVSPNGRFFLFESAVDLADADTGGSVQQYLYDADAEQLSCISCRRDGQASRRGPRGVVSDSVLDNGRAFVTTSEALVAGDTNSVSDVYEWSDGRPQLISTGRSRSGSYFAGASATGDDVFFTTREQLVGQDRDDVVDMYDARVGGGIAAQSALPGDAASCTADACQGTPAGAPAGPAIASVAFVGAETSRGQADGLGAVKVSGAKTVTGRVAKLTVRVPQAGSITLSGSQVMRVRKSLKRAGTYALTASLTSKARKSLSRKGVLEVAVRLRFAPRGGGATSMTVHLRFKQPTNVKRGRVSAAPRQSGAKGGR